MSMCLCVLLCSHCMCVHVCLHGSVGSCKLISSVCVFVLCVSLKGFDHTCVSSSESRWLFVCMCVYICVHLHWGCVCA